MNYPFWDIPYLGSGWVIGIIAIFHVMISQFAVGGGLYLPLAERKALRESRNDWLDELVGYSKFFLILTGVFGMTPLLLWEQRARQRACRSVRIWAFSSQ